MGTELVLYSEAQFWRGRYERLNRIIDVASKRREIDKQANEICRLYTGLFFGLEAQMLPIATTGVKGDKPDYGYLMEIICTGDPDYEILARVSTRITNEIDDITRVVYRVTEKNV